MQPKILDVNWDGLAVNSPLFLVERARKRALYLLPLSSSASFRPFQDHLMFAHDLSRAGLSPPADTLYVLAKCLLSINSRPKVVIFLCLLFLMLPRVIARSRCGICPDPHCTLSLQYLRFFLSIIPANDALRIISTSLLKFFHSPLLLRYCHFILALLFGSSCCNLASDVRCFSDVTNSLWLPHH